MRGISRALILAGVSFCPTVAWAAATIQSSLDPYGQVLLDLEGAYPSGHHFDLTIVAASTTRPCTTPESVGGARGQAIYVPSDGRPARVFLEWGRKGHSGEATLEVADACAGFEGAGDAAVVRLPEETAGYAAFARNPGGFPADGRPRILDPDLGYIPSQGPDAPSLLFLGVVSADGVFTVTDQVFPASEELHGAKDVTPLFLWTGMACYPFGLPDGPADVPGATVTEECCELAGGGSAGTTDLVGTCGLELWDESLQDNICHAEWLACVDYSITQTWVFNLPGIGDSFWGVADRDSRKLELLFYPLPLRTQTTVSSAP